VNETDRQHPFRVGRRNSRNIYAVDLDSRHHTDDEHIGCMFNPADGPAVVNALNAVEQGKHDTATAPATVHQYLIRSFEPNFNGDVVPWHGEGEALSLSFVFATDEQEAARVFHAHNPLAVIRDLWQLMPPGYLGANVFTPDRDDRDLCATPTDDNGDLSKEYQW
jgi:hypothetical protein